MPLTTQQMLALLALPGVGRKTALKVGASLTERPANETLHERLAACRVLKKTPEGRVPFTASDVTRALDEADRLQQEAARIGVGILSYDDPAFPESLRQAVNEDGRPDPAAVLFVRGDLSLLTRPGVAVIGTRRAMPRALTAGRWLAGELAKRGCVIVSGLALGCDAAAHEGALATVGGQTIAVLGNGLDHIYPAEHRPLAERIVAEGGLLVSEYPFGTRASRHTLVERDRLQAALAGATLVVQTSERGGSLHAAKATRQAGKPLYVVQYADQETAQAPETAGNHWLVDHCGARPIGGGEGREALERTLDALAASLTDGDVPPGSGNTLF